MTFDITNIKPDDLQFKMNSSPVFGDVKEDAPQRFSGIGYSGEPITNHPFWGTVAFDLSQMDVPDPMPILLGHDPSKIAGWSQSHSMSNEGLKLDGILSKVTESGKEITALSKEGFPWQMSVRISPKILEEVMPNEFADCNGRQIQGPAFIFRKSKLTECSFTPIGWDSNTSATALSVSHPTPNKEDKMSAELEAKVKALEDDLLASNTKVTELQAKLDAEIAKNSTLEASQLETLRNARIEKIKNLFSVTGEEDTEDARKPFLSLSDEAFSMLEDQAKKIKSRLPEGLFSEQALDGKKTEPKGSSLVSDAERRAEAFSKKK